MGNQEPQARTEPGAGGLPAFPEHSLFSITWPIFIDLALHHATLVINLIMVGMVSVSSVAELTVGNQVFDLAMILFNFFNIGICVVSAQALGAGNRKLLLRVVHMGYGINLMMGLLVAVGVFLGAHAITILMQVPPEIAASSETYLAILSLSLFPEAICMVSAAILRAHDCSRDAMYVSLCLNAVTMSLNAVFLFGLLGCPAMGVEGVAISTAIGRVLAVGMFIPIVLRRTGIRLMPGFFFSFRRRALRAILGVGLPGAGENLSWHGQYMLMTSVIASFGALPLATHGIYFQICMMMVMFAGAVGMGTEILVAHYAGSLRLELAYRQLVRSVLIGECITVALSVSMPLFLGSLMVRIFTSSEEVMELASSLFIISLFMEPGRILNIIIINSLRACGDTRFPLVMAVVSMWGISVPLGTFLGVGLGMGLVGVWLGFCADEWVRGIAMVLRWRSRRWEEKARRNFSRNLAA